MVADSPEAFNPDPPHLLATVCSFFSSSAIHFPARSGSSPSNHLRYTCSGITRRQRGFLHSGCEILDVTDAEQLEWLVTAEVAKDQPSHISQVCFWGPLGDLFISELILVFFVQHRAPGGKIYRYIHVWSSANSCYTYYASQPMNFSHHSRPPTNDVHPPGVRLHIAQQDWKPRQGQANLLMSRHHRHS